MPSPLLHGPQRHKPHAVVLAQAEGVAVKVTVLRPDDYAAIGDGDLLADAIESGPIILSRYVPPGTVMFMDHDGDGLVSWINELVESIEALYD